MLELTTADGLNDLGEVDLGSMPAPELLRAAARKTVLPYPARIGNLDASLQPAYKAVCTIGKIYVKKIPFYVTAPICA